MQKLTSDSQMLSYKQSTYITFLSSKAQWASWETGSSKPMRGKEGRGQSKTLSHPNWRFACTWRQSSHRCISKTCTWSRQSTFSCEEKRDSQLRWLLEEVESNILRPLVTRPTLQCLASYQWIYGEHILDTIGYGEKNKLKEDIMLGERGRK